MILIKELGHAVPLAKALVEGGLDDVLEITPRGPAAVETIRIISARGAGGGEDRPQRARANSWGRPPPGYRFPGA